jgi:Heavy metal associated domain 2
MSVKNANAAQSSSTASVAALPAAIVQPVAETGRRISNHVTGGVQWYLEQWEDLLVEVKAQRAGAGADVAGIRASLAQARVVSEVPGRVRLRLKELKGRDQLAWQTLEALANVPGIRRAQVSSLTGSVLIFYDTAAYRSLDSLLQAVAKS